MTDKLMCILTQKEIMEKLGSVSIYGKEVRLSLFLEEVSNQISFQLIFAVDIDQKDTLSSTFQELVKYIQNYTKNWKRLKMDWYTIQDMDTTVGILEVQNLSYLQTINLIFQNSRTIAGDYMV